MLVWHLNLEVPLYRFLFLQEIHRENVNTVQGNRTCSLTRFRLSPIKTIFGILGTLNMPREILAACVSDTPPVPENKLLGLTLNAVRNDIHGTGEETVIRELQV